MKVEPPAYHHFQKRLLHLSSIWIEAQLHLNGAISGRIYQIVF
jgi:hypothetical protein